MDCMECRDNLSAYLEAEVAEPDRQKIAEHIRVCPPCLAEYEALADTHRIITEHIMIQAPPALWSRVEAQIRASAPKPAYVPQTRESAKLGSWISRLWSPFTRPVLAGGLALIGLVLGLAYFMQQQRADRQIDQAIQAYVQERDKIEASHMQPVAEDDIAKPTEYDNNPFVIEDRHHIENPFKL